MKYPDNWKELSKSIRNRDKRCIKCGSVNKLQTHHLTPLSHGGSNEPINLVTLCERCHSLCHKHLENKRYASKRNKSFRVKNPSRTPTRFYRRSKT